MKTYLTLFYKKANGEEPAKEYLLGLNSKMRAKTLRMLKLLQENGISLRLPYSEELENGIFELRTKVGSDVSRLLYFFDEGKIIILTNGFVKKSQKTPVAEITRAKEYRDDYLKRKRNDEIR